MDLDMKVASKGIHELLWRNNKTLTIAESCTAGRVSSAITAVPGSSAYFKGGIVAYSNEMKTQFLGVDAQVIAEKTAVCEEVVRQMVVGACEKFGSDYAVAVTGFAGPNTGEGAKFSVLVGTIWIAVGNAERMVVTMLEEDNGRDKNLNSATNTALHMLLDYLRQEFEDPNEESIEDQ